MVAIFDRTPGAAIGNVGTRVTDYGRGGPLIINAGRGRDAIQVSKHQKGSLAGLYEVNVNGRAHILNRNQMSRLTVKGGRGKDAIMVDRSVDVPFRVVDKHGKNTILNQANGMAINAKGSITNEGSFSSIKARGSVENFGYGNNISTRNGRHGDRVVDWNPGYNRVTGNAFDSVNGMTHREKNLWDRAVFGGCWDGMGRGWHGAFPLYGMGPYGRGYSDGFRDGRWHRPARRDSFGKSLLKGALAGATAGLGVWALDKIFRL